MLYIHETWHVHRAAEFHPAFIFHFPWTSNINMETMVISVVVRQHCHLI
jgi:hypothetical protein